MWFYVPGANSIVLGLNIYSGIFTELCHVRFPGLAVGSAEQSKMGHVVPKY